MLVKTKPEQIVRGPDVKFTDMPDVLDMPDKQAKALIEAGFADPYTPEVAPAETAAKRPGGETAALVDKNGKKI